MGLKLKFTDSQSHFYKAVLLFFGYLTGAFLGQFLTEHSSYTAAIWPPSGITLAVLILTGRKKIQYYIFAAFFANIFFDLVHARHLSLSLFYSSGNILESVAGAVLITRFSKDRFSLSSLSQLVLLLFSALVCSAISATIGVYSSRILYDIDINWFVWWSGDVAGVLIFTPLLITLASRKTDRKKEHSVGRIIEFSGLLILLIIVSVFVFCSHIASYPSIEFLIMIPLLWSAFRFEIGVTALNNAILSCVALWGSANGYGPFAREAGDLMTITFAFQTFVGSSIFIVLASSIIVREQKKINESLQQSEERFRTTLYSIGDGVITTDINGNVQQMNHSAEELTGWVESEAQGGSIENVFRIINESTRLKVENPIYKVINEGLVVGLANHTLLIRKDGKEIPIADSGAPIKSKDERIIGAVLVFRDKTEEQEAALIISKSEARLNRAELASKSGNWELHLDSRKMIASEGAEKLYGVDKDEFEYDIVKKIPLQEYRPLMDAALKNLIEKNEPYDIEFKIKTADTGEIKDIHSVARFDRDKRILFGVIQDITERKKAESALVESEEQMRMIIEGTPYLFFYTQDSTGNVTYISPSVEKITGYTADQWIGQQHWFVTDSEINRIAREKTRANLRGEPVKGPIFVEISHADGRIILLEVYENPIIKEKKIVGLHGIAHDITERKLAEAAIQDSEKRYRFLFMANPMPMWIYDTRTLSFLEVNDFAVNHYGYSREEFLSMTLNDIRPAEEISRLSEVLEKESGRLRKVGNVKHKIKDGTVITVEIMAHEIDFDGIKAMLVLAMDITERKKAEDELLKKQHFIESILENSPIGFALNTINDGKGVYVGSKFEEIYGVDRGSINTVDEYFEKVYIDPEYREKIRERIMGDIISQDASRMKWDDIRIVTKRGEEKIVNIANIPLFEQNLMISTVQDVTQLRKAEKEIRETEERYRTTLYSIGDGVIATDERGLITQINPIAEQLTGWKEDEARDRPLEEIFKIINEETRNTVENPVHKVLREGKIVGLANHTLLISKNGSEVPIADSGAPIRNENGNIDGVVLVFRDQTKDRETQLRIINSLKEKEILLKEIHHRVKNNFQRIISLIGLQAELINDKNVLNIFEELQTRLRSMSLIHELMYGSGQFTGVDIKEYVEKLAHYLIRTYSTSAPVKIELDLENHNLDLDTIIPCGLIINELITNSLKYAFPVQSEGIINVSFRKIEDEFSLTLSDNGVGVVEKIDFENISSLGLRLVDLLVKQLRGSILAEQSGKGLKYTIKFRGEN